MALTDENALQLRGYTLRNDGAPFTDILDADGKLRITVFPDFSKDGNSFSWDPASTPAAEALTVRILALLNGTDGIPTHDLDGVSLKAFAEIVHEAITRGKPLSSPARLLLDKLRGAAPATARDTRQPQLDTTTPRGIAITQAIGRAPPPPTPLLDIARLDAGRRFTLAERNDALAELRTLRQMIEPAALRPGFVFHGSAFNPDIAIEWGLPCDGGWREPTLYHSTIRDALVHEINVIDRLRRAQQGDQ